MRGVNGTSTTGDVYMYKVDKHRPIGRFIMHIKQQNAHFMVEHVFVGECW